MTKAAVTAIVSLIVLAVGFSLAMIPLGKPTPWQLIGAPAVVNTDNLISASGEPDYLWTVHFNDVSVGLLPCEGFGEIEPKAGDIGVFCSEAEDIELENTPTETILRVDGTSYRYSCVPDSVGSEIIEPLLKCEVEPMDSIFA